MSDWDETRFGKDRMLPPLPLEEWKDTKNTLHLYLQIVGKVRMAYFPRLNHWWHVTLYVSPRGLTTGAIPFHYGNFQIELDFVDHVVQIATSVGGRRWFDLAEGLSVAQFYENLRAALAELGIEIHVRAVPYDTFTDQPFPSDTQHAYYDKEHVERFQRVLVAVDGIFQEFRGRFTGKSTPVHVFWHSFDLALTRFSGRRAPERPEAGPVEREAYSHEVISFGFWAGDDRTPAPSFYCYVAPEPPGLTEEPLRPAAARWGNVGAGAIALLPYDEVRQAADPRQTLLDFLQSAYEAGAKRAGWDQESFLLPPH